MARRRPCLGDGIHRCPNLTTDPRGRCQSCRNVRYGAAHKNLRKKWRLVVEAGRAICARCGWPIRPSDDWDLGHGDDGRHSGAEHRSCNEGASPGGLFF